MKKFFGNSMISENPKWETGTSRLKDIYHKAGDIRSEFQRDYTRILHSTAYRRLKHKTQVFFATRNDHICTRIEHVNHVASVSHTISNHLGLNTDLTSAIATGHDLGHAPFGHAGESVLKEIASEKVGDSFWHERNSLRFIDLIETLPNSENYEQNLNLTYAVRDGIISHCGEVDENALFPRTDAIQLQTITSPSQHPPYTWEGCVVKISDKIAYLGRDIEDAINLGILTLSQMKELKSITDSKLKEINNTTIIHNLILDICENSSPETGICLSQQNLETINSVKEFNYKNIYYHQRLQSYKRYVKLIIKTIFEELESLYASTDTIMKIKKNQRFYTELSKNFSEYLLKYSNLRKEGSRFLNDVIYDIESNKDYCSAVIDYISGMSDNYALDTFKEITSF